MENKRKEKKIAKNGTRKKKEREYHFVFGMQQREDNSFLFSFVCFIVLASVWAHSKEQRIKWINIRVQFTYTIDEQTNLPKWNTVRDFGVIERYENCG